jgi:membrane-bound ClpP family serine protease
LTEEETWNLSVHLTTRWGLRLFITLAIGIILIVIGAKTIPFGAIAIVIGAGAILYGLIKHMKAPIESKPPKSEENQQETKASHICYDADTHFS